LATLFLDSYFKKDSYLDWGDDPSFFSAQHRLGDVNAASWGVCRRDVRSVLTAGEFVVFFCGQADLKNQDRWDYFFIGVGTVLKPLPRADIWQNASLTPYRAFYNVLAELNHGAWIQRETFHPYHPDWESRAESPYILFDPANSAFNLSTPLHVAIYTGSLPEMWRVDGSQKVRQLRQILLLDRGITGRGLRTARRGYGHAKLNLMKSSRGRRPGAPPLELRAALLELVTD
jgi:hypothetical protein